MSLNAVPASERIHIGIFGRRNAGKSSLINAITGQNLAIVSDVKGTTTDPVLKSMELLPLHIGIFGRRNAGKSSLINAITGQNLAIVSDVKGTTTDPVLKSMELLPLGPVVIIDTPGLDDLGELGSLRIQKARQMLNKTDLALLVLDGTSPVQEEDLEVFRLIGLDDLGELGSLRIQKARQMLNKTDLALLVLDGTSPVQEEDLEVFRLIKAKEIPCILVINKCDLMTSSEILLPDEMKTEQVLYVSAMEKKNIQELKERMGRLAESKKENIHLVSDLINPTDFVILEQVLYVSAMEKKNIQELKERMGRLAESKKENIHLVSDLINPTDFVILVIPIDKAAPKGRLILPQQQTIRDILEKGGIPVLTRDSELETTLKKLDLAGTKPALVITDSQIFAQVSALVPKEIPLTSFSILFARYKGSLDYAVAGAKALDSLQDGDCVLAQVSALVPKEIPLTSFSILFARYKGSLDYAVAGAKALDSLQDGDCVLISEGQP